MAAATTRSGRKLPSIRTLWAIAKSPELGLTDEDLHGVVYRETGKGSMKHRRRPRPAKHEGQRSPGKPEQAHG